MDAYRNELDDADLSDALDHMVRNGKVQPYSALNVYKSGDGIASHYDCDATFFTAVIVVQDSAQGRQQVEGYDVLEKLSPGDMHVSWRS